MKRMTLVMAAACALGLAVYAAGAWSAASATPAEKQLQKDVKVLKTQVKALQTSVKKLSGEVADTEDAAIGIGLISICGTVVMADAVQGTWQVIDQASAATQAGKTYFGAQTPVDDKIVGQGLCQAIGVTRSQTVPPTIAQVNALLALFKAVRAAS